MLPAADCRGTASVKGDCKDERWVDLALLVNDNCSHLRIKVATMTTLALSRQPRWARFFAVAGPGLVVMFADTDAGSIITAAQSGAQWGYRLLLIQLVLIPG